MVEFTPIKVVEKDDLNSCGCCGAADSHRLYLFGKKSMSEGILKAFKDFTGLNDCEDSSFLCRSCAAKITNILKKISDLKSVFQWYERERKKKAAEESLRFKRGHKEGESHDQDKSGVSITSPVPHLAKKAMITTPPTAKASLALRFQKIAPKPSASHVAVTTSGDSDSRSRAITSSEDNDTR